MIYSYRCNKCAYVFDKTCSMADRNEPKCCPKCGKYDSKLVVTSGVGFADPFRLGRVKASDSFRDTLRDIKSEHPGSTINVD